jgi:tRNA pseudouridine38-40 synthase
MSHPRSGASLSATCGLGKLGRAFGRLGVTLAGMRETNALTARITLAYDGSEFHGWQVQPGLRTVQGSLTAALQRLLPLHALPPGAGRTDAGVHARGQVASLPLSGPDQLERLQRALPALMPDDVQILRVQAAAPEFHARHSARGRHYSYRILPGRDPLRRRNHWCIERRLDVERMQRACVALRGRHDCTSFAVASSLQSTSPLCEIRAVELTREGDALIFRIAADRFLHSMVRTIVGTLVEIGYGRRDEDAFASILSRRDRQLAGSTAPAHGLSLDAVDYEAPELRSV